MQAAGGGAQQSLAARTAWRWLITCGGSFDRSSGHYRDNVNVIVYAQADN
jgi:hypothetical protein